MQSLIALKMVALNVAMNLALVFPLQERGLALATAVCAMGQVVWLSLRLNRTLPEIAWRRVGGGLVKMATATAIMAGVLMGVCAPLLTGTIFRDNPGGRLAALVIAGVVSYALAARVLRLAELGLVLRRRRSRPAE